MLSIPPPGLMRIDISRGACVEGHRFGRIELLLLAFRPPHLDRVDPVETHPAALGGTFACVGERNRMDGSQTHLAGPAVEHEPEDPRLGPAGAHLEVKPAAIVVHSLPVDTLDLDRGELVRRTSHVLPQPNHNLRTITYHRFYHIYPQIYPQMIC